MNPTTEERIDLSFTQVLVRLQAMRREQFRLAEKSKANHHPQFVAVHEENALALAQAISLWIKSARPASSQSTVPSPAPETR